MDDAPLRIMYAVCISETSNELKLKWATMERFEYRKAFDSTCVWSKKGVVWRKESLLGELFVTGCKEFDFRNRNIKNH